MFFRISCFVRFPAYQTGLDVEPLNGAGVVAAKSRIACIDMGDDGTAPAATASVDGVLFVQFADPALRLSTIGQIAVVFIFNVPRLLCCRKFEGGLRLPLFVLVQATPLLSPEVASSLTVAVLLYVVQALRTTVTERVYVKVNVFVPEL